MALIDPRRGQVSRRGLVHSVWRGLLVALCVPFRADAVSQREPLRDGVRSFDHVAIPIQDVAAMAAFYRRLGFTVIEANDRVSVHFGDQKLNFHPPSEWQRETFTMRAPAARPPCGDFCFVWEGSQASLSATLERVGAVVLAGPVSRPGGRNGGKAVGQSIYIRDPDGNLLEFMIYSD